MTRSVVVVGGGIAGLGVALGLVRRGVEVTIVDSGASGGGATYGNAGWVSTAQAGPLPAPGVIGYGVRSLVDPGSALRIVPRGIPTIAPWLASFALQARRGPYDRGARALSALGGRSVAMLDELAADGVPDTGRDTGMLVVAMDPAAVEHAREEMEPLVAAGEPPPGEILDGDAVRALEPVLSPAVAGGFVVERHRQVDPWPLSRALVAHLAGRGVRFVEGVAVTAVDADGPVVRLRAGDEVLGADAVVIATGAHAGELAGQLGVRLPLVGGRGCSVDVTGTAPMTRAVMVADAHVALSPIGDRVRIAGTMELPATSAVVDGGRARAMVEVARRATTGWSGESLPWAGLRPLVPDGLPVVDALAPRVFVATAYSMLGMTVGLPAGDALAELIDTGTRPGVLEPFRADRRALHLTRLRRSPFSMA
jgi:D-amino-acid dehydrogenase